MAKSKGARIVITLECSDKAGEFAQKKETWRFSIYNY